MGFIGIQNNKFSCIKLKMTDGKVGTTNCITRRTGRSTIIVSDNVIGD
jgi:hypothetical protein